MKTPSLINIVSNPFFLAAVFLIPLIVYHEKSQKEFIAQELRKMVEIDGVNYHYDDLDMDGSVELIRAKTNNLGEAAFVVEKDGKVLDQFNLEKGVFPKDGNVIFFGDYDHDSIKEIYCLTQFDTEIWLHVSDVFDTLNFRMRTVKVDSVLLRDGKLDYTPVLVELADLNQDGYLDLVFHIMAGFSKYPRRLYIYDVANDSLHKSIPLGVRGGITQIIDIDNDSIPEILFSNQALANMKIYDTLKYSDNFSWFMVFDKNLDFKFEPYQLGERNTYLRLYFGTLNQGYRLISILDKMGVDQNAVADSILVSLYSEAGKLEIQKKVEVASRRYSIFPGNKGQILLLDGNQIYYFDTLLNKQAFTKKKLPGSPLLRHSIKSGDETWYLFWDQQTSVLYISDQEFDHYIETNLSAVTGGNISFFIIDSVENNPAFAIQTGNVITKLMIVKNPHYQFRVGYYAGAYFTLYFIVWFIQFLQRRQIKKTREIEKEIQRLQFATLKNQLEPHFTMNVLNAIAGYVLKNSPDAAYDYIVRFSRMINSTLKQSDELQRTLHDEIEFVKDYLELQKLRFRNNLHYKIEIGESVPSSLKIPKMLIQSHVENAIKHGLKVREGKGNIRISISKKDNFLLISVADDGIGRHAAGEIGNDGTGKGLKIMGKYYKIFKSLTGKTIFHTVKDLINENGKPAGTEVVVKVAID
jgi:sensor histidine kinase YesM